MNRRKALALLLSLTLLTGCGAEAAPSVSPAETAVPVSETSAPTAQPSPEPTSEPSPEPTPEPEPEPDPFQYETALFGGEILDIDITADQADWDYLMENALEKPWISVDLTVNGETFPNVGIKTKGNTSLSSVAMSGSTRFSFKVNFGKYEDGQTCYGLDKLALNNIYADNTYLKEYMSYDLMRYMEVPSSLGAFCNITVNGEPWGLYLALEDTDDSFLARNYGEDNHVEAYKPESMDFGGGGGPGGGPGGMPGGDFAPPMGPGGGDFPQPGEMPDFAQMPDPPDFSEMPELPEMPQMPGGPGGGFPGGGPGGMDSGVSLQYTDDDPESYSQIFDNNITKIKDKDKTRLIESLKSISEGENLEDCIDVDEVLRYAACNVFLVNLDSYFSTMGHNYILVENRGQLSMLPWDYNLSFGTHESLGSSGVVNYAIDTVFHNVTAEQRPLISKLLEQEEYRERYHQYLRQIAEDYVGSGRFAQTVSDMVALLDASVAADSTSFGGYEAFQAGWPTLILFGELRAESVLGQLEGTIPAEEELQTGSDTLIDASALNLSLLGSMGMGHRPGA